MIADCTTRAAKLDGAGRRVPRSRAGNCPPLPDTASRVETDDPARAFGEWGRTIVVPSESATADEPRGRSADCNFGAFLLDTPRRVRTCVTYSKQRLEVRATRHSVHEWRRSEQTRRTAKSADGPGKNEEEDQLAGRPHGVGHENRGVHQD